MQELTSPAARRRARSGGARRLHARRAAAQQPGLFDRIPTDAALAGGTGDDTHDDTEEPPGFGRSSVALHGFNLHAAVHVGAADDDLDQPAARDLDADDSQLPPPSSRPGDVSLPDD